jgi:hypothetical protein
MPDLHETVTVSAHATSEGMVSYVRCSCGAWEVRVGDDLAAAID